MVVVDSVGGFAVTRASSLDEDIPRAPRLVFATILVLLFLGATTFLGGVEMLVRPFGSVVLPAEILDELPVDSFVLPGLVLATVFGIGAALVAYGLWRQPYLTSLRWVEQVTGRHWAWAGTLAMGAGFVGWMLLQLVLLGAPGAGNGPDPAASWTLYAIYGSVAAWLLIVPWTQEVKEDLRIIDLATLESRAEERMVSDRVLVAYGSTRGGTAGLAEMIGERLALHGFTVEVRAARSVRDVSGFGAVLLGGALYASTWHRDARLFSLRHRRALRGRPVWLFSSGPLDDSASRRDIGPVWQARIVMDRVGARGHATFGGVLEEDAEGWIAGSMSETMAGDFRDPEQIARWVTRIAAELEPLRPLPEEVAPDRDASRPTAMRRD